jgi:LysM repeat protein
MWQFGGETNQQRSPILAGQTVDQDYCYYDYPSVIKNGGFNGYPKTEKADEATEKPKKTNEEIAFEVLDGKWGTKETTPTRKERLEAAGYDYQAIQDIVNEKLGIKKSSTPTSQYYIIRWGDTLTSIAKKYDTTVEKLCELNGISDPNLIFAGNQLKVR